MHSSYLIVNAKILTALSDRPVVSEPQIFCLENKCVFVQNGIIKQIGNYSELKQNVSSNTRIIDLKNRFLLPGFIDCHTHPLFDGKRINDFIARIEGKSYQEIALSGGGIKYTVQNTINSPHLKQLLVYRLNQIYQSGSVIIEAKNGYAIEIEKEIEHLKLIIDVSKFVKPIIIPTFLAHIPPDDFDEYLNKIKMYAPEIRKLTKYFDIFCDKTAFSVDQTIQIVRSLTSYHFAFRFHTNEFQDDRLVEGLYDMFGNSIEVKSFDHLLVLSDFTIKFMRLMKSFGVIMPGTSWFLGKNYSLARKLIENHIPICLATDFNAGSSNVYSMLMVCNLACIYLKLKPEEVLCYITTNPAFMLDIKAGQIRQDFLALFNILDTSDWREFCFCLDHNLISPLILQP
ncbi:MAG: hypothetical protein ABDH21_00850 [bacterium]